MSQSGKESNWKFFIGIAIGLIPFFANYFFLTRHDENLIVQSLIQEFTSDDPVRLDLALELLRETVSETRYEKYKSIVDRKIVNMIEAAWSSDRPTDLEAARRKLISFASVRPEWKALVNAQEESHRKRLTQILAEAKDRELRQLRDKDFKLLLELGSKRLEANDCFGAYTAFRKAKDYDYESPAIDTGLTIARNCVPENRLKYIETIEKIEKDSRERVSKMSPQELVDELNRELGSSTDGTTRSKLKENKKNE